MITAHFPSGYLLAQALPDDRKIFWAAILGAVCPDLDLIWFYVVDDRAFHHHRYWPHIPAVWIGFALLALPLMAVFARRLVPALAVFIAAVLMHIVLDTVAGDVLWGWPLSDRLFHLIEVPAIYGNWVWNFILHPVFLAEVLIWVAACLAWQKARQK